MALALQYFWPSFQLIVSLPRPLLYPLMYLLGKVTDVSKKRNSFSDPPLHLIVSLPRPLFYPLHFHLSYE